MLTEVDAAAMAVKKHCQRCRPVEADMYCHRRLQLSPTLDARTVGVATACPAETWKLLPILSLEFGLVERLRHIGQTTGWVRSSWMRLASIGSYCWHLLG